MTRWEKKCKRVSQQLCFFTIGGGRSFKVRGKEYGSGGRDPGAQPLVVVWGQGPQKLTTLCGNMRFCHGFKNDSDICIHCLTSVQYEMVEKSIWRQKSHIGLDTKSGQATARRVQ